MRTPPFTIVLVLAMPVLLLAAQRRAAPRRWDLEIPPHPRILAWSGFDPARHTPNISNDQTVYPRLEPRSQGPRPPEPRPLEARPAEARPGEIRDDPPAPYQGGICWGLCELSHLCYRAFHGDPGPSGPLPGPLLHCLPGIARRTLRELCLQSVADRERVCAIAAALQLDAPPDSKWWSADTSTMADRILQGIRQDGSVVIQFHRTNPADDDEPGMGHDVLAYAMFDATARCGDESRPVVAIRIWDPMFAHLTTSEATDAGTLVAARGRPGNPLAALLFDPAAGAFTFSAAYLERKNFAPADPRHGHGELQPDEYLVPGRDLLLRRPSDAEAIAMLESVTGTSKHTDVGSDRWPEFHPLLQP